MRTLSYVTLWLCACGSSSAPPIGDTKTTSRICPAQLDMELIGSQSRFNPGYSGIAHGVGLAQGSRVTVDVLSCDAECRRCTFHGPVRGDAASEPIPSQRCLNAPATVCADDAACGPAGPCRYIFPPITATVIAPSCTLVYFEPVNQADVSPMQGTIDLDTGEADLPVMNLKFAVSTAGGCNECIGEPVPFDGTKGGTCKTGGVACDVNGVGTAVASSTSYDCPPPSANIVIGLPANGTSTASRMWTMDGTRPKCTDSGTVGTKSCWCGVCSDGTPCFANNQCATGSCGFAGSTQVPVNTKNNSCTGACNWDPVTSKGTCSNDAARSCFPDGTTGDSIIAEGTAEVNQGFYIAQLANLVCMPQLDHGLLDAVSGFPGPLLFEARFKVTPRGSR